MQNVQLLSDDSLRASGFSDEEIRAAAGRNDAYVGEKNGVKYYRAQNELNIQLGEHKTRSAEMPGLQGEEYRPDR